MNEFDGVVVGGVYSYVFLGVVYVCNEWKMWMVIGLCMVMMIVEIVGGMLFGLFVLVVDGLYMLMYVGVMLIVVLVYIYVCWYVDDLCFVFGIGKFGDFVGFMSVIVLVMIVVLIGYEVIVCLLVLVLIYFGEVILIVVLGFVVNFVSVWLFSGDYYYGYGYGYYYVYGYDCYDDYDYDYDDVYYVYYVCGLYLVVYYDYNIWLVYVYVIVDVVVLVLVIVGLLFVCVFGWVWMDLFVGIVGVLVIVNWVYGLMCDMGRILFDVNVDCKLMDNVCCVIEVFGDMVNDFYVWCVGFGYMSVIVLVELVDIVCDVCFYYVLVVGFDGVLYVIVEVLMFVKVV